jgi:hypothetical protein
MALSTFLRGWTDHWRSLASALAAAFFSLPAVADVGIDYTHPWNPATPLPQFSTHDYIDPAALDAFSKYRSNAGHAFSDNYEPSNRSLKNYFEPRPVYLNTNTSLPVFAPATGILGAVTPEGHTLLNGEHRGFQLSLIPDGYPQFEIRLFHVNLAVGLDQGTHVTAGDPLGFADLREAIDVDWAVGAAWNATPTVVDPGQVPRAPGYRLLSPFDLMTDAAFANYARFGLTDRAMLVVPLEYRNAHPALFGGTDLANFDQNEYFTIAPIIRQQPGNVFVVPPGNATFTVVMGALDRPLFYQWKRNGIAIAGATATSYTLPVESGEPMGFYSVTIALGSNTTDSTPALLDVYSPSPSRLTNISTRGLVRPGGAVTAGFVLRGVGSKTLVARGIGPTLGNFGLTGALANPRLEIIPLGSADALFANDDWETGAGLAAATAASGAFALPVGSADAATLSPLVGTGASGYSVRITPAAVSASGSGIVLAEVYDTEPLSSPLRLVNVSTRGFAGLDAETLIVGFTIGGSSSKSVLVRAVGPGLESFDVSGVLADPRLTVRPLGSPVVVAANDNWSDNGLAPYLQSVFTFVGAFSLTAGSKDAALVTRLPPGNYTVQVGGVGTATGEVLVEVYDLDP